MPHSDGPTTAEISSVFAEEVRASGGTVSDRFDDGARLFIRSILPRALEVRPRDGVQGGVALRATKEEICVHPYVLRLVCQNGAIIAHGLQTEHIDVRDCYAPEEALFAVRAAVQACCVEEAFTAAVEEMRSAVATPTDVALNLMPLLAHLPSRVGAKVLNDILARFTQGADSSRFGLMNAVTSVARDTHDPDLRWRLEEFGGGIPAGVTPTLMPDDTAARWGVAE